MRPASWTNFKSGGLSQGPRLDRGCSKKTCIGHKMYKNSPLELGLSRLKSLHLQNANRRCNEDWMKHTNSDCYLWFFPLSFQNFTFNADNRRHLLIFEHLPESRSCFRSNFKINGELNHLQVWFDRENFIWSVRNRIWTRCGRWQSFMQQSLLASLDQLRAGKRSSALGPL